jgi:hypothetical protein
MHLLMPLGNGVSYAPLRNANGEPYEIALGKVRELAAQHRASKPIGFGGMVQ